MIPGQCPASRRGKAHECIRKQLCRQGHGVLMSKSNICQRCVPVGKAANQTWICINEIVVSRSREVVLPPLFSGCKTTAEYSSAVWLRNKSSGCTEAGPEADLCYNARAHDISGKAEKAGLVQTEEEKAKEGILLLSSTISRSKDDVRALKGTQQNGKRHQIQVAAKEIPITH